MQAEPEEKHTKTNANERQIDFRTEYILCACRCAQLLHRTQHGTVLIIFPLNIQKIAKMHLCDFDIGENRAGFSFKRKNFGGDNGCAHGFLQYTKHMHTKV